MPVRNASDSQTAAVGTKSVKIAEQLLPVTEARKTVRRCQRLQTRMSEAGAEMDERQMVHFLVQVTELAMQAVSTMGRQTVGEWPMLHFLARMVECAVLFGLMEEWLIPSRSVQVIERVAAVGSTIERDVPSRSA